MNSSVASRIGYVALSDPGSTAWHASWDTHVRASEYAGTDHCRIDDLEARLSQAGFRWHPISLYHFTPLGTPVDGS